MIELVEKGFKAVMVMVFSVFKKLMRRLSLLHRHKENKEKIQVKGNKMPKMKQTLDGIDIRLDTIKEKSSEFGY